MARHDLALRLREARRTDRRLETVAQFKQAMTAPDWEMDDYQWRAPSFCSGSPNNMRAASNPLPAEPAPADYRESRHPRLCTPECVIRLDAELASSWVSRDMETLNCSGHWRSPCTTGVRRSCHP